MRYKILLLVFLFSSHLSLAQNKPDKAFAITGNSNNLYNWINIQEIDLSTGEVTRRVFEKEKTTFELIDSKTKKKIQLHEIIPGTTRIMDVKTTNNEIKSFSVSSVQTSYNNSRATSYEFPTAGMVAAAAYDQRHNKIFFTPMNIGELRWIDLYDKNNALKVFCLTEELLTPKAMQHETTQVTRMVIAADGNGYALSNDANHFVRFTTGKTTVLTQLGALKDDPSNDAFSIHNRSMFGGDMIADAFGDLYLFTANGAVFKININTLTAKHLGIITGLPQRYTTNGAAVNINGDIIVSSATSTEGYFKVDLATLKAVKAEVSNQPNSSDLASGNLAFDKKKKELSAATSRIPRLINGSVSVFPNPVTQRFFKIDFKRAEAGQYFVQLMDLSGKMIFQKRVNVAIINQRENVTVDQAVAKGVYMLKIVDGSKKIVSSGNIVIQ